MIDHLARHHALGNLEAATPDQRRAAFAERAGRQLLVALHEATLSKPFEEIIQDEFNNIVPLEAQRIYLSICVLNRLDVPVRAGIIARIHGIVFTEFKQRLFAPLEQVVQTEYDSVTRDYLYRARHPHIAEIVFQRILRAQEDRYDVYIRCLRELNIDYSADNRAFRQMVRGRTVLELFPNHELALGVYEVAFQVAGDESHLVHQRALYEMNRPSGNLEEAGNLLGRAAQLAPRDLSIQHSIAEHRLRCADFARSELERDKLLKEATQIAMTLKGTRSDHTFGHHTLVKIGLRRLRDLLNSPQPGETEIEQVVKDIERNLSDGLQRLPGDSYLLDAESQLAQLLNDSARALAAMERAFAANQRNAFAAIRLAFSYRGQGDGGKAKETLERALDANRSDRRLNFEYARLLIDLGGASGEQVAYHLKRSFTPGDSNYHAQLLYARQLFIDGDREDSRSMFRSLESAHVASELREALLYSLEERFKGRVVRREASYSFIARDGVNDWIYAHRSNIGDDLWRGLGVGARVSFRIAFTLRGPRAFDVAVIS